MDLQTEAPAVDRAPPVSAPDSSAPRERVSVRDTLKQSFAEARQRDEAPERDISTREAVEEEPDTSTQDEAASDRDTGRVSDRDRDTSAEAETETPDRSETKAETAPTSWSKEAKESWKDLPERARAEIAKREKDMEKGVKSLKDKYKEVDEAIAPYVPVIQEFGKTPGQAVGQLFAWFDALAKNPDDSFPALIQSYKYDPRKIISKFFPNAIPEYNQMKNEIAYWRGKYGAPQVQQQQQTQPNGQVQPNGQAQPQTQQPIHPQVQQYIQQLHQEITGLKEVVGQRFTAQDQYYEQQNAARTQEMLEQWAKDKPHFEKVRTLMGHLLTPDPNTGVAAVPLKDGKVDLDAAYDYAVYASPEVRAEILAEQQAQADAARKAKQEAIRKQNEEKAAQARRASGSLTTSAPSGEVGRKTVPAKGVSVRDSLKAAIAEISER